MGGSMERDIKEIQNNEKLATIIKEYNLEELKAIKIFLENNYGVKKV